ncbi:MAG: glutamate racemase [Candidatus Riflebacteria bacterium]|nr:glutamate racemase [Candidatus Riflebacteria bacterium]
MDERPIGVFDSGVGGLTVVKELRRLLPTEDIIYFGDTARVPYGNKSIPVIRRFCLEITRFLEAMKVKMIVVACNTASSLALDYLRRNTELPVIGVIEPGVQAALRDPSTKRVGIIGTTATVRSEAYQTRLKRLRSGCIVSALACPLLVPIVEENLLNSPIIKLVLEMYLSNFRTMNLDTLILACTHYPLLKPAIAEFFGDGVRLVDSAEETSREVAEVLKARRISAPRTHVGSSEFYVSDSPDAFMAVGSPFLGYPIEKVFLEPVWQRDVESSG